MTERVKVARAALHMWEEPCISGERGSGTVFFSGCGLVGFTDEEHADAGMVIEGCTPAFAYMFIEALADGAVHTGLTRSQATRWAAQAVAGAAAMVLEGGRHPGQFKDEVCSPGGVTIEGVRVLERGGFRGAVMDAVIAAHRQTGGEG